MSEKITGTPVHAERLRAILSDLEGREEIAVACGNSRFRLYDDGYGQRVRDILVEGVKEDLAKLEAQG